METLPKDRLIKFTPGNKTEVLPDPNEIGVFLRFTADQPAARHIFKIGTVLGVQRFTCNHRYEPFWMVPSAGTNLSLLPKETQFLLLERESNYTVFVPLVDGAFRASLQGSGNTETEQEIELLVQSGDPAVVGTTVTGLFVATGEDPYTLVQDAAVSVSNWMGTGRLRSEKPIPSYLDQFGWCTWDAFYREVSHEKIREGLQTFADGGIEPRYLILDDGWQTIHKLPSGEERMTSFAANEKFPEGLAPTVQMAKNEFEIERFFVWHGFNGYWGGVDGDALPGYGVRTVERDFAPEILEYAPTIHDWFGKTVGLVSPEHIYRFYQDFHRSLRKQGVDGVKVDVQAALEGIAAGSGGRVELMQRYREAVEGSVHTHFKGNLINCMSCASEMFYSALNSNMTRTSTDFWPLKPESHGLHLYTNAQVSLWFGEFTFADWDMFQSGHEMGGYHAAGRAVGGCPVYVSDKPDAHNFEVLQKLVLPDGQILRADNLGRPTLDCLFHDPTKEDILLKIFNTNNEGNSGVIGVFNTRYDAEKEIAPITGTISPSDVVGLEGDQFAVYAHNAQTLTVLEYAELQEVTLPALSWEIYTIVPINNSFAAIGLVDMLNTGGSVVAQSVQEEFIAVVGLAGRGTFVAWSEQEPEWVAVNDEPTEFMYDPAEYRLTVLLPDAIESESEFCGVAVSFIADDFLSGMTALLP